MPKYTVTVRTKSLEYYEVEADSADDAMENWQDGRFLATDFETSFEAEPFSARLITRERKGDPK